MLYNITLNEVATIRAQVVDAVNARIDAEKARPEQRSLSSKLDFLVNFRKRCERVDAFTLGFLHSNPADFGNIFLSHRRSGEMFNIYAMTKALEVAKCLNGSELNPSAGGDHMTLAGVILAIGNSTALESAIAFEVNKFAQEECSRPNYSSGATQTSSSLRALEAFGIVKKTGKISNSQMWGIDDTERFERMLDAAKGISVASVTKAMSDAALADVASSDTKAGRAKSRSHKAKKTVVPATVSNEEAF